MKIKSNQTEVAVSGLSTSEWQQFQKGHNFSAWLHINICLNNSLYMYNYNIFHKTTGVVISLKKNSSMKGTTESSERFIFRHQAAQLLLQARSFYRFWLKIKVSVLQFYSRKLIPYIVGVILKVGDYVEFLSTSGPWVYTSVKRYGSLAVHPHNRIVSQYMMSSKFIGLMKIYGNNNNNNS